jgi:4-hydroxy-tetrahydrodipicolinate synthase
VSLKDNRFTGVLPAALTPLKEDLTPDDGLLAQHCKWLLANGSSGLAVLGTTGEANSFSLKERIRIIESLVEAGVPGEKLLPGTGSCSLTDAVELTRVAVNAGAGGVLMLPPFYYKNPSDEGLFAFFSEVIQRVADDRLQIYIYHFPQMSSTPISYNLIEMLLKAYPDTVAGMKDSSGVLENMTGAAKNFPGFHVLSGADDLMLPVLQAGGAGAITACANVCSSPLGALHAAFVAGEETSALHAQVTAVRQTIAGFPLSAALKQLMARHTGDQRWLRVRPPLTLLSETQVAELYSAFDAIGCDLPAAA